MKTHICKTEGYRHVQAAAPLEPPTLDTSQRFRANPARPSAVKVCAVIKSKPETLHQLFPS